MFDTNSWNFFLFSISDVYYDHGKLPNFGFWFDFEPKPKDAMMPKPKPKSKCRNRNRNQNAETETEIEMPKPKPKPKVSQQDRWDKKTIEAIMSTETKLIKIQF